MSDCGVMDDGMTVYTPGVNCIHCGRFVGRDGSLSYEHFEMSSRIASLDGECRRCIDRHADLVPLVEQVLREWDQGDRWLTAFNIRNVIENGGGERYSVDEIQRATWSLWGKAETDHRSGHVVYRWKREARA